MDNLDTSDFPIIDEDGFSFEDLDHPLNSDNHQSLDVPPLQLEAVEPLNFECSDSETTSTKWTEVEQDIFERICADHPDKGWEYMANFFPFHPKAEIKKKFKNLKKRIKPQVPEDRMKCLRDLKDKLACMEKDLLGSCQRIKELIKKRN